MGKTLWAIAAVFFSIGFLVFPAHAYYDQTITISGCTSCFGSVYTLTVSDLNSDDVYEALLSINTENYKAPKAGAEFISAVNFKVSSNVGIVGLSTLDSGWTASKQEFPMPAVRQAGRGSCAPKI